MKASLEKLQRGDIGWAEFFQRTDGDWKRFAKHLRRRYRAPSAVDAEDMESELKLAAFQAAESWDPKKAPFPNYVIWTAANKAVKWLHTQRKALRRDGRSPSRVHINFSEFEVDPEVAVDAVAHEHAERFEVIARCLAELDDLGQRMLVAVILAHGDVDGAAEDVYDDKDMRRVLRLDNREHARRKMKKFAAQVVRLIAA